MKYIEKRDHVKVGNLRILFLSYNKHQYKFFSFLHAQLKPGFAFHLTSLRSFFKGIFVKGDQALTGEDLGEIIQYSYIKFKARRQSEKEDLLNRVYHKYLSFKAYTLYKCYNQFMDSKTLDLLVVWNGYGVETASAIKVARAKEIKVIYMENGFFPHTLVMDDQGVNAANSLAGKDAQFYQEVRVDPEKLAQLKRIHLQQRELRKKFVGKEEVEFPAKFFFLPFQVHTDTQVLLNSPHISNMYDLVDTVYSSLERFNDQYEADYWLVVKEHPSDFGRINYENLKEKYRQKKVIFTTTVPSSKLIELSKAVVTINSTVGLEALIKGKPVITLGEAFYNVDGVVHHCDDLSRLHELMSQAVSCKFNVELVDKLLYFLRYEYLVETDKNKLTKDNIIPILNRLEKFGKKD